MNKTEDVQKITLLVDNHPDSIAGYVDGRMVMKSEALELAKTDPRIVLLKEDGENGKQ